MSAQRLQTARRRPAATPDRTWRPARRPEAAQALNARHASRVQAARRTRQFDTTTDAAITALAIACTPLCAWLVVASLATIAQPGTPPGAILLLWVLAIAGVGAGAANVAAWLRVRRQR